MNHGNTESEWIDISWPLKGKIRQLPDKEKPLTQEITIALERSKGERAAED
jgi:hypothetical protein